MKLYCISGLGADERAFQRLDLSQFKVIYVQWIDNLPNESLVSYAHRLSAIIDDAEPFALMGLSFGGMLAVEISKFKKPAYLILLSTIVHVSEKPFRMKIFGKMGFYKYIPSRYFTRPSKIAHRLFGANKPSEKALLNRILEDSDPIYIKWALGAISKWVNESPVEAIRIHGTKDKLFPMDKSFKGHLIAGGGHLMVITHANQVSEIIRTECHDVDI